MNNNFYVYMLYDSNEELPFYIGKGNKQRLKTTTYIDKSNPIKAIKLKRIYSRNDEVEVELIGWELSEQEAFNLEVESIEYFGLIKDKDDGCLSNLTYGGEGSSGYKHTEEALLKMSEIKKNNKDSLCYKTGKESINFGRKLSPEHKRKISPLGRKHTEKSLEKMRKSQANRSIETRTKLSNSKKVKIMIDGIEYPSYFDASKELNCSRQLISRRIKSEKYPNYYRLG